MSQNEKVAIVVIVVLVLAGLGYYWYQHSMNASQPESTFVDTPAAAPSGTDTSDKGLQQDTAAIDAQMSGLTSDQMTVNSSVNDSADTQ